MLIQTHDILRYLSLDRVQMDSLHYNTPDRFVWILIMPVEISIKFCMVCCSLETKGQNFCGCIQIRYAFLMQVSVLTLPYSISKRLDNGDGCYGGTLFPVMKV